MSESLAAVMALLGPWSSVGPYSTFPKGVTPSTMNSC